LQSKAIKNTANSSMTSQEKIIVAAEELFWLQGYKNTPIAEIIEKAAVNKGSFFHFFSNKDALLLAVVDHFYDKELVPLFKKNFQNSKKVETQLLGFCDDINSIYQRHAFCGGCLLGNLALELSDVNEDFRKRLEAILLIWQQELAQVLKMVKSEKTAKEIADFIIWGLEGITLTGKVHKNKAKNKSEFALFQRLLKKLLQERA